MEGNLKSQTNMEESERDTETRSSYLIEGLFRSHGRGFGYEKSDTDQKTVLCKDMAPIYTVEKRWVRELVRTLNPRYQMQIEM